MAKKLKAEKPAAEAKPASAPKARHEYDLAIVATRGKALEIIASDLEVAKAFEAAKRVRKVAEWCAKQASKVNDKRAAKLAKLLEQLKAAGLKPEDLVAAAK